MIQLFIRRSCPGTITSLDIVHAFKLVSKYMKMSRESYWLAINRIWGTLKATKWPFRLHTVRIQIRSNLIATVEVIKMTRKAQIGMSLILVQQHINGPQSWRLCLCLHMKLALFTDQNVFLLWKTNLKN